MCGRYTAAKDFNELIKLVGVIMARAPFLAPRYNIAPTQLAPVIYMERHQPAMKLMRWGLIPSWAKDASVGSANINARSETLQSRNSFREAFKHRRCLIPADSFYEWQEREGKRQPFRVMLKSGEPFCFAGLWERWIKPPSVDNAETDLDEAPASETIDSFTIITRAANAAIAPLHEGKQFAVIEHFKNDSPYAMANGNTALVLTSNDAALAVEDYAANAQNTLRFMASNIVGTAQKVVWERIASQNPARVIRAISDRCAQAIGDAQNEIQAQILERKLSQRQSIGQRA